jgi:putative aldouronate transport system permease protein
VLPLSKPLLATFVLFSLVGFWNDYFWALIFLRDQDKQPIQLFLRRILILVALADLDNTSALQVFNNLSSRTMKSAALIITITPILCVYPFLQKYFTKGLFIGSLKD